MHYYVKEIKAAFSDRGTQKNAVPMANYMQNKFEFLGIKNPLRKQLQKDFLLQKNLPETTDIPKIILDLWSLPQREYQYFAVDLLKKTIKKLDEDAIDLYEKLIITKSWWDTVDMIAARIVGTHFLRFPKLKETYIPKWMNSGNFWLQRTCLLFQLHYKDKTDFRLLKQLIEDLPGSKEFFINKAIGWALRQYSKTDAQSVIEFVHDTKLAPLSEREALKWLKNEGKLKKKPGSNKPGLS